MAKKPVSRRMPRQQQSATQQTTTPAETALAESADEISQLVIRAFAIVARPDGRNAECQSLISRLTTILDDRFCLPESVANLLSETMLALVFLRDNLRERAEEKVSAARYWMQRLDYDNPLLGVIHCGAPPHLPAQRLHMPERLSFDDATLTVAFDGDMFHNLDHKAYWLLKTIAKLPHGERITRYGIGKKLAGFKGDKAVKRCREVIPPILNSLIISSKNGFYLQLPTKRSPELTHS